MFLIDTDMWWYVQGVPRKVSHVWETITPPIFSAPNGQKWKVSLPIRKRMTWGFKKITLLLFLVPFLGELWPLKHGKLFFWDTLYLPPGLRIALSAAERSCPALCSRYSAHTHRGKLHHRFLESRICPKESRLCLQENRIFSAWPLESRIVLWDRKSVF